MRRRDFLKSSGSAAAVLGASKATEAAAGIVRPALIGKTIELTLASPWPSSRGGFPDSVARFAHSLQTTYGTRLRLRTDLVASSGLEAVTSGASDIFFGPAQADVAHHPALGYFAGLPGHSGLNPDLLSAWLSQGGGQALWDETSALFGVKSILVGHTGPSPGFWSTRRIRSLADISSEQIYAEGLAREVVKGLGGRPSDCQPGEVTGKLARAEIFAAEWGNPAQSLTAGFPAIAKFCTTSSISRHGSALAITFRKSTWDGFDAELQNAITTAASQEMARSIADARDSDDLLRRALIDALQIDFVPLPPDVSAAIDRISGAIVADVAAKDALSVRINQSYLDICCRASATRAGTTAV